MSHAADSSERKGKCVCACGARLRFEVRYAGKTVPCKRCGHDLLLRDDSLSSAQAGVPKEKGATFDPSQLPPPIVEVEADGDESSTLWHLRKESGYWSALLWSLLFPSSTQNLVTFLTLWGIIAFITLLPLPQLSVFYYLSIFWIAIWFWWVAFRMEIVEATSTGQYGLPDVDVSGHILVDLLDPALRWCGSWLVVLLPALVYAIAQGYAGVNVIWDSYQAIENLLLLGTPGPGIDATLASLTIVGLFFWPLVLVLVLFGGFAALWRVDLVLFSLGNTLLPYLLTVSLVVASYGAWLISETYLSPPLMSLFQVNTMGALISGVLKRELAAGIDLYTGIFMARVIGLYFRHFGHRLAWDWGQKA